MTITTVRVDRRLIAWALQQTSTQCAIALALKDANDNFVRPVVTQEAIHVTDARSGIRYHFKTPKKIAEWIDQFDRSPETTKPLTFTVDLTEAESATPYQPRGVLDSIKDHQRYEARQRGVRPVQTAESRIRRPLRPE